VTVKRVVLERPHLKSATSGRTFFEFDIRLVCFSGTPYNKIVRQLKVNHTFISSPRVSLSLTLPPHPVQDEYLLQARPSLMIPLTNPVPASFASGSTPIALVSNRSPVPCGNCDGSLCDFFTRFGSPPVSKSPNKQPPSPPPPHPSCFPWP